MGMISVAAAGVQVDACSCESNEAAFERAFNDCADALYRYFVVRTRDTHTADDLMQQVWLLARRGATSVAAGKLEPWLRVVAKNALRTHWRSARQRPQTIPLADPKLAAELADRLATEELPRQEFERREVRDQLMLAITELHAADQELVIGRYFENVPHAVLAQRCGLTERAIEGRLYRARQTLREKLKHLEAD